MTAVPLIVLALLLQDPEQEPAPPRPALEPLSISRGETYSGFDFTGLLFKLSGSTRVREYSFIPARTSLGSDLGFSVSQGARIRWEHDDGETRWFAGVEYLHGEGRGQPSKAFHYDEGSFSAGVPYKAWTNMWFVRLGVEPDAWGRGPALRPRIGLLYAKIDMGIEADDGEGSTENYKQFLPIPFLGLASRVKLSDSLSLDVTLDFAAVPRMPTIYTEGTRMYMAMTELEFEVKLTWTLDSGGTIFAGFRYQYFAGHLDSSEDTNDLAFHAPGLIFGLELKF